MNNVLRKTVGMRFPSLPVAAAGLIPGLILLLLFLSGCAGPVGQGNMALLRGDYQQAEALFQKAIAEDPENLTARRRLGMTYFYMGRDKDPTKFGPAVEQFEIIGESRTMQPEEQFYYGLSLIGQGHRDKGFAALKTLSHPTKFRVQQFVRERAAQLEAFRELPLRKLFAEMEKSWREGEEEDRREKIDERDNDYGLDFPIP
jgi:tetratricopeptide (TPR) repeat protein